MRAIVLFALFFIISFARENPFSPSSDTKNESFIAKEIPTEPMRAELLRLPIDAVRVKRVTIEYQKVDGTKEKRTFELEKQIAQDVPLLIRQ